jgi:hypothetical protein
MHTVVTSQTDYQYFGNNGDDRGRDERQDHIFQGDSTRSGE